MDRISVNPQIHFGKPCIVGTRITVQSVLELLNEGLSFGEIIQDYYPDLEMDDIRFALRDRTGGGGRCAFGISLNYEVSDRPRCVCCYHKVFD